MTLPFRPAIVVLFALVTLGAASCSDIPPAPTDGLVAHYGLDGDAADSVGISHGTVVGAEPVTDRFGEASQALRFAGEGDYIEISHTTALDLRSEFTIAAWIQPGADAVAGQFSTIFEKSDPERNGHSRYGLWLRDGRLWTCFEAVDNSRQPCAETTDLVTAGEWHHVAAVRSGRRLIVYVDGVEATNTFVGLYEISQTPHDAFIGTDRYQQPAEWLHATLDDIRIYDRALDPAEISRLAEDR